MGFNEFTFWWLSQPSLWSCLDALEGDRYQKQILDSIVDVALFNTVIFSIDFFLMCCMFLSSAQKYTALLSFELVWLTYKLWPVFLSACKSSISAVTCCGIVSQWPRSLIRLSFLFSDDDSFLYFGLMNFHQRNSVHNIRSNEWAALPLWFYCPGTILLCLYVNGITVWDEINSVSFLLCGTVHPQSET